MKFIILFLSTLILITMSLTMIPVFGKELEWKSYNSTVEDLTDPVHVYMHTFNTQYRIFNGTGTFQVQNYAFIANIDSKTNGMFELHIPKNFPYYNGKDGPSEREKYIVIENGYNLTSNQYTKTTSDCFFTYSIPFYMNSTITVESTDTLFLMTPIYGDKILDYCMSKTMIPDENLTSQQILYNQTITQTKQIANPECVNKIMAQEHAQDVPIDNVRALDLATNYTQYKLETLGHNYTLDRIYHNFSIDSCTAQLKDVVVEFTEKNSEGRSLITITEDLGLDRVKTMNISQVDELVTPADSYMTPVAPKIDSYFIPFVILAIASISVTAFFIFRIRKKK